MNKRSFTLLALAAFLTATVCITAAGQSRDVNFPSPVLTNEINGVIAARDIGDSRVTTYFYTFDGGQGDIFINLVTKNFAGDVDIFLADGLRPMTKMVVFANADESETGRLIYLRKPEKLILRVEGRTPNDDPATFRIKFGGSFIASTEKPAEAGPTLTPQDPNEPGIKVNSVGTIVAVIPKPEPPKPEPVAKKPEPPVTKAEPPAKKTEAVAKKADPPAKKPDPPAKKPEVVVTEKIKPPPTTTAKAAKATPPKKTETPAKKKEPPTTTAKKAKTETPAKAPPPDPKPDPLANVRLVIELKDGTTVWLPMPDVQRFGFDKGVLTVVAKDGTITRYPILNVAKVTMQ